jgi:hypothetical protein
MVAPPEVYFLADKHTEMTLAAFTAYQAQAKYQTEQKLKQVCTDIDTEFNNALWDTNLTSHGVSEHRNHIFIECMCTMFCDTGLPTKLWAETAATVAYLYNFIPSSRHPEATPYELWNSSKPDITHLCAFGCNVYTKIPEEHGHSKPDIRSTKSVLIGYFGHSIYRLYDFETGHIFHSRNVIFKEDTSPYQVLPAPEDNFAPLEFYTG